MMMMNRRFSLPALPHPLHRKNHRSSMTTMNSGVNLSVKIHGIFDSELLAARLLGPGSRRDGSVLLPSQINNVKASSSSSARQAQKTSSSLTNNSNNTSINPSSTTASTTTSTTIAKPKPSLSTIISSTTAPTTNKRSSSSISTDDENPIPNPKRRRHSAPEVSHPRPTVSPSPPPHQTNPGSGVGVCQFCSVRKTGQWRRGPAGQRTLCNACGINWSKKVKAEALRRGCSKRFRKVVINVLSEVDEGMEEADEMESGME
ncbi:hypothetical protein BC829DRAFT_406738 [Chytridium lagenaria]|nr:hypothetical protein BC829DRAFT_406738 [Chytridium lagenaria]